MTTEKTTEKKTTSKKTSGAKAAESVFTGYESFVDLGKDNLDAAMQSGAIFAQGMEELNTMIFAMARANMEESLKASKVLMSCKTPEEFCECQSDLAKASYEKTLEETRKITDVSVKLAEKAGAPLAERVSASVELFNKTLAA